MHPCQNYLSIVLFITALPVTSLCAQTSHHSISDDQSFIRFDMPPTAPAVFTETSSPDSPPHFSPPHLSGHLQFPAVIFDRLASDSPN